MNIRNIGNAGYLRGARPPSPPIAPGMPAKSGGGGSLMSSFTVRGCAWERGGERERERKGDQMEANAERSQGYSTYAGSFTVRGCERDAGVGWGWGGGGEERKTERRGRAREPGASIRGRWGGPIIYSLAMRILRRRRGRGGCVCLARGPVRATHTRGHPTGRPLLHHTVIMDYIM
jgi:hypothetical protein